MTATVHAAPGSTVYRELKSPAYPGQLRSKAWRCLAGTDEQDPLWVKRCREYWERHEQVYGLKMTNFAIMIEPDGTLGTDTLVTYAAVREVLPGPRVPADAKTH